MQYNTLGDSELNVSQMSLGTMTFGEQNTAQEGFEQLDYAIDQGVNLIDTAELYAIPPCAETYGATERIIGQWIERRGKRDDFILASKIAGPGPDWVSHIRGGHSRFDTQNIDAALNNSLSRLKTDYIDLYQLHWPERNTNFFGKLGFEAKAEELDMTPVYETLSALDKHVRAGKIRYIGLSNETPWGMMKFLQVAREFDMPAIISVQNPYSLLNRTYEVGCAEISHRENVGLLAYSPLGFGVLSGKYLNNQSPPEGRLTRWPHYGRYNKPEGIAATEAYVALAEKHDLDPAQMALAYVNSRPFVASTIIGATTMQQLKTNLGSGAITLSAEVVEEVEAIHSRYPNPAP